MPEKDKEKEEKKEEGSEKKKSNLILFIVIGVLVLLLVIIGIVVMMMMGGDEQQTTEQATANAPKEGAEAKAKSKTKSNLMTLGPLFPLDQVIVNLLSQSGRRYLKVSISFEMSNPKMQPELDSKKAVIRDIVISILSSKTLEEISTSKGKEKLKDEIMVKVNEIIVDGEIKNIFFTDFVIQ